MSNDFRQLQNNLTRAVREPKQSAPQFSQQRLQVYRDLVFNNIESFLRATFPVLHQLLPAERWQQLARDFVRDHRSHSPYFLEISREFLGWLQQRGIRANEPPFLLELAHYEWLELALDIDETDLSTIEVKEGDLMTQRPLLSPLVELCGYQFPVHRIGPQFQPQQPDEQPTWLLVWRNRNDRVEFMELNAVSARLIALLQEDNARNGEQLLLQLADELQHLQPAQLLAFGETLLKQWRTQQIVLGTRST
jgi:uncharacterized protein